MASARNLPILTQWLAISQLGGWLIIYFRVPALIFYSRAHFRAERHRVFYFRAHSRRQNAVAISALISMLNSTAKGGG